MDKRKTHSIADSVYLYQSVSLSPSSQSVPSSSSHSLLTFPQYFTAIPQHIIISPIHCIGHTTVLITLHHHFWRDALQRCYDPQLNNMFKFLGLQTYLKRQRFTIFSIDGAGDVKNITYMGSGLLRCACDLIRLISWIFLWF